MQFRIADTFTSSLGQLTNEEQKAAKTTSFDLQMDPTSPGMKFHRVDKSKDRNFWSIRVTRDIRIIVHKTESDFLLCYVGHHDDAYRWAERRKIENHPKTGAAQLVEVRESVKEIIVPKYVEQEHTVTETSRALPLFQDFDNDYLLAFGIPPEWLEDVKAATEDTLFKLTDHLPQEAAEALLEMATGGRPEIPTPIPADDPFEHPDAKRRFSSIVTSEELQRALDYPWEKWIVFLHPDQEKLIQRDFSGPVRISGSAGTGKTIVALHRAAHLLKNFPETRCLLTTFSDPLASSLQTRLNRLIADRPRDGERIDVASLDAVATQMFKRQGSDVQLVGDAAILELLKKVSLLSNLNQYSLTFLMSEWSNVVDAWQIGTWEGYRDIPRLGRKKRLSEKQRAELWAVFEKVRSELKEANLITMAGMYTELSRMVEEFKNPPYDFIVIDEAQDLSVPQLRFLASLGRNRQNSLFFAGDLGQRIFQQPFSWKSLGIDIRGRGQTLKVNYRTSHQIRSQADLLLPNELSDIDGNVENRQGTVSVFEGVPPEVRGMDSIDDECSFVSITINKLVADGVAPHEIGLFVRSEGQVPRAIDAVKAANQEFVELDAKIDTRRGHVPIAPMHLAKGLEFRAVIVMACDDEILPLQSRIEQAAEESDLEEVYQTERHLLYVACTRARDFLYVTGVDPISEFLDDLRA